MLLLAVKTLHITTLVIWCAGMLALPLMLAADHQGQSQEKYTRLRLTLQATYIWVITPAAVIAVFAGTALIFLAEVYVPWMFAKLVAVGFLVGLHGLTGHAIIDIGENPERARLQLAVPRFVAALGLMAVILVLVLGKPVIPLDLVPDWLMTPRDIHLPFDEVPI
ncbi:membrane protein [Polymorphobacter multimanifer]|uniref:Protoporphyrinogen IX oxidase n=1 Tax=Polymorphobacter multimanifer TaxID=1070431 RepID=A0A841L187_9SPHN|nr:CopD family protein [Polymorphobacter multimanifer]MBB6226324.1 putative membrane protein [Polymorphobacter multimanifer]GGI81224.1 membrane protein [Polymorphobacter multimanifer]